MDLLFEDSFGYEFVNEKELFCVEECKYNVIFLFEFCLSEIIGGEEISLIEGNILELNNFENNVDINFLDYINLRIEGFFVVYGCKNDLFIFRGILEIDMDFDRLSDCFIGKNFVVLFV